MIPQAALPDSLSAKSLFHPCMRRRSPEWPPTQDSSFADRQFGEGRHELLTRSLEEAVRSRLSEGEEVEAAHLAVALRELSNTTLNTGDVARMTDALEARCRSSLRSPSGAARDAADLFALSGRAPWEDQDEQATWAEWIRTQALISLQDRAPLPAAGAAARHRVMTGRPFSQPDYVDQMTKALQAAVHSALVKGDAVPAAIHAARLRVLLAREVGVVPGEGVRIED